MTKIITIQQLVDGNINVPTASKKLGVSQRAIYRYKAKFLVGVKKLIWNPLDLLGLDDYLLLFQKILLVHLNSIEKLGLPLLGFLTNLNLLRF